VILPLIYECGKSIFFAHVPKTGGTSVQMYMIRRFGSLALLGRHRGPATRGTSLIVSAAHLSAQDLEEVLPRHLDGCFAVVRDPIKRLQSEYQFQKGTSKASRVSFSTWLRFMISAARCDARVYDNHIRPQVDFLPEGTKLFKLEEGLSAIVPYLDKVLGYESPLVEIPHLLKSKKFPVSLSREDVRLIVEYYRDDYDRFGYPEPDYSMFPRDSLAPVRDLIGKVVGRAIVHWQRRSW
jgi:hypothetical protein